MLCGPSTTVPTPLHTGSVMSTPPLPTNPHEDTNTKHKYPNPGPKSVYKGGYLLVDPNHVGADTLIHVGL
ncbi:hypothetical protein G9A89_000442 [Geosiphon pyriformis]|nr:hypothetical protein G9A89_000442 [Geosiphon pyriformis]